MWLGDSLSVDERMGLCLRELSRLDSGCDFCLSGLLCVYQAVRASVSMAVLVYEKAFKILSSFDQPQKGIGQKDPQYESLCC